MGFQRDLRDAHVQTLPNGQIKLRPGTFDFIYPGDAWLNVLKRSNIYLNNSLG